MHEDPDLRGDRSPGFHVTLLQLLVISTIQPCVNDDELSRFVGVLLLLASSCHMLRLLRLRTKAVKRIMVLLVVLPLEEKP